MSECDQQKHEWLNKSKAPISLPTQAKEVADANVLMCTHTATAVMSDQREHHYRIFQFPV